MIFKLFKKIVLFLFIGAVIYVALTFSFWCIFAKKAQECGNQPDIIASFQSVKNENDLKESDRLFTTCVEEKMGPLHYFYDKEEMSKNSKFERKKE